MVALRPFGRRHLIVRLSYSAFACACAIMLAGCDLLVTILPQGGANAAFAYADPRLEKSVRIKSLNEVFNIAVAPDGRVFAIARDGVAEYTADLKHVRTYYPDAAEGIQRRDDGDGPEEWQVTTTIDGITRLHATKNGAIYFLFDSGLIASEYDTNSSYGFFVTPGNFSTKSLKIEWDYFNNNGLIGGNNYVPSASVRGFYFDTFASLLYTASVISSVRKDTSVIYNADINEINDITSAPVAGPLLTNLTTGPVKDEYKLHRFYVNASIVALVMGYNSYIGDVESSTFIFDRALGGEPIARFDLRGAITAAADTALYAITRDHDENGGWIHKLRFKP